MRISFGQPDFEKRQQKTTQKNNHLFKQTFHINRNEREQLNGHPAFTIWLTGLSGSGKSTIAAKLDQWFHHKNIRSYIIDGDNTRMGINSDLNFTREGRQENIRRVAEMARLFNEAGLVVISSFISPYQEDREQAQLLIGASSFIEVFVEASIETCISRDTKGLYKLAQQGKISNFTGVSSPYEPPPHPNIRVVTDQQTEEECLNTIINWLHAHPLNTTNVIDKTTL
jgi:adenylyl-sulfate kinase